MPHSAGPGRQNLEPGKVLFGTMLRCFAVQFEGLGGPKKFHVGSCKTQVGDLGGQKAGLEATWGKHGPILSQLEANLGQIEANWSQPGAI